MRAVVDDAVHVKIQVIKFWQMQVIDLQVDVWVFGGQPTEKLRDSHDDCCFALLFLLVLLLVEHSPRSSFDLGSVNYLIS
eukprot:19356_6